MYKKVAFIFGWIILISIIFFGYWNIKSQNTKIIAGTLVEISFLGLKKDADCILVKQGEVSVLIDTGEKQDAQKIVSYLKAKNVTSIEYLILTHPDADHIGGAVDIIDNFKVKNIIEPNYAKSNEQLEKLNKTIETQGIHIIYPTLTRKFSVGEMNLIVYPPLEKHYTKDNNYSLATLIKHGKVNMLFAGDAEKKRLEEMLLIKLPDIDLIKIPHHGRASTNSEQFIRAIRPKYAVVTSISADEIIKKTFEEIGTQVFYTGIEDKIFESNGDVLVRSTINIKE
jgi:competence protein ComEC